MKRAQNNKIIRADFSCLQLALRNFTFYLRSNILFCAGCAVSAVILIGALLVGSSLRESLRTIQDERLGNVEWVIQMPTGGLGEIVAYHIGKFWETNTAPIFSRVGSVGVAGTSERVHRVNIIGVDEKFWKLSPQNTRTQNIKRIRYGEVVINKSLAEKLNVNIGDDVIARFQKSASLTMEAPFGLREDLITHNLTVTNIIDENDFGDFSLRAEHSTVYNAFVSLILMQYANDMQNKANAILIGKSAIADEDDIINKMRKDLQISDVGLNVRTVKGDKRDVKFGINTYEIYSDRVFISDEIRDRIVNVISGAIPVSTWFVNSIRKQNSDSITPYSFVSSMPSDYSMNDDEIILSRWTADDLNANVGDTIVLTYFVPRQTSGLRTDSAAFVVSQIISDTTRWLNRSLAPPYPGLAGSESCTDWNPSIPIDLDKIREKDEAFWSEYEATPKAIISYNRAAQIWDNRFGVTTAIRIVGNNHNDIESALRLSDLTPILRSMGMQITNVRNTTNAAINNGIDFAPLFLGLSFFTLAASLMLIWLMSSLQIKSRRSELKTLRNFGFSRKRILSIYIAEGMIIFSTGTIIGIALSPLYTHVLILALKTVWQSAALVPSLSLHVNATSIIIGGAAAFVCALVSMIIPIWSATKQPRRKNQRERVKKLRAQNFARNKNMQTFNMRNLILQNILRDKKNTILEIAILACALFILGVTQLFHQAPTAGLKSGSGGFYYYGELNFGIPLEETTAQFLRERGVDVSDSDFVSIAMRVKDGDDASCLNLNQAQTPTLAGVPQRLLDSLGAFSFTSSININGANKNHPWKILSANTNDNNTIYGIADANTVEWGLGKKLGDTLIYMNEQNDTLRVIIAAALKNSILQGKLIIAETEFIKHFPSVSGYRVVLVSPPVNREKIVAETFIAAHDKNGLMLEETSERLNTFNAVENTYLSIFALLGIFGLALGCFGQGIIIARNVEERRHELATLTALGFSFGAIKEMLFAERAVVMIFGLIIGLVPAFIVSIIMRAEMLGASVLRIVTLVAVVVFCAAASLIIALRTLRKSSLIDTLKLE